MRFDFVFSVKIPKTDFNWIDFVTFYFVNNFR